MTRQLIAVVLSGLTLNVPAWSVARYDTRDLSGISATPSTRVVTAVGYTNKAYNTRRVTAPDASSMASTLRAERDRLHTTVNSLGIPNDKQMENFIIRNEAILVSDHFTAADLHSLFLRWQAKGYVGDETSFDTFFRQSATKRQAFVNAVKSQGLFSILSQEVKMLLVISVDLNNIGYVTQPRIQLVDYYPNARLRRVIRLTAQQCSTQQGFADGAAVIGGVLMLVPAPSPANAVGVTLALYSGAWTLMKPWFGCP